MWLMQSVLSQSLMEWIYTVAVFAWITLSQPSLTTQLRENIAVSGETTTMEDEVAAGQEEIRAGPLVEDVIILGVTIVIILLEMIAANHAMITEAEEAAVDPEAEAEALRGGDAALPGAEARPEEDEPVLDTRLLPQLANDGR